VVVSCSDRQATSFWLVLDSLASASVSALTSALQDNTVLDDLTLFIDTFALQDVHGIRAALRMNAGLTKMYLDLGGITIVSDNLLPRSDRRRFRALLQPDHAAAAAALFSLSDEVSDAHSFYVALSDLSDPATWQLKGRGNFGAVMAGELRASGTAMCIKVFEDHSQGLSRLDNIRNQINELALVQELGEAQVAALASTCVFASHFAIDDRDASSPPAILVLLPLMHGTLEGCLSSAAPVDLLRWLVNLGDAFLALHQAGLLHRDMAIRNVLLERGADGELVAKACDFGLSCAVSSPWQPELVPVGVWPPETIVGPRRAPYSFAADVWAFGLLLVDMLRRGRVEGRVPHAWLLRNGSNGSAVDRLAAVMLGTSPNASAAAASAADVAVAPAPVTTSATEAQFYIPAFAYDHVDRTSEATDGREADPVDAAESTYQRYAEVDDETDGYTTVDLHLESDEQQDRDSWQRRIALSAADLAIVPAATREWIPLLVEWCMQVDPACRPSMKTVSSLLRSAAKGASSRDWAALPEAVVPARLAEACWTQGDGHLLAALCRQRGRPVVVADGELISKVSEGGAQLLCGLTQMQQVCVCMSRVCFEVLVFCDVSLSSMDMLRYHQVILPETLNLTSHQLGVASNKLGDVGAAAIGLILRCAIRDG
jgi:serine/threonine protein kinase